MNLALPLQATAPAKVVSASYESSTWPSIISYFRHSHTRIVCQPKGRSEDIATRPTEETYKLATRRARIHVVHLIAGEAEKAATPATKRVGC